MLLNQLGEFGFIDRIRARLKTAAPSSRIIVGPGDDAFAATLRSGYLLVGTKDLLVEDVHFKRAWAKPEEIGYKAMAVNISDLASMGWCTPLYALTGLALPGDIDVDFVDKLYTGMNKICRKYGVRIVGGDTVSSKKGIVISITLLGEAKKAYMLLRSGAQPGDAIMVTGTFGDSGGGLHMLINGMQPIPATRQLIKKHLLPEPRVKEATLLAARKLATSMIDSSDGLDISVRLLAQESSCAAEVQLDALPLSRSLRALGMIDRTFSPVTTALTGAEEYELVFTVPQAKVVAVKRLLPHTACIGKMVKGSGVSYFSHGSKTDVPLKGFEHFHS